LKAGFVLTGEMDDDEAVARLELVDDDAATP